MVVDDPYNLNPSFILEVVSADKAFISKENPVAARGQEVEQTQQAVANF